MVKQTKQTTKPVKTKAPEPKMEFGEGAEVMARWPGSSLFFKAKVIMQREEEDEYDVEFENGTVYTLKVKDVFKVNSKMIKKNITRGRSKSKGRGRKSNAAIAAAAAAAAAEEPAAEEPAKTEATEEKVEPAAVIAVDDTPKAVAAPAPKPKKDKSVVTPSRVSKRIAAKATSDAFSDDESDSKVKLAPNPELPDARGKRKGWSFEWVWALVFMILGPAILVSLHTLCTKASCKLETPNISTDLKTYYNLEAIMMLAGFWTVLKLLKFLPIGAIVNGQRMNGFASLLVLLSAVPALVYNQVPLGLVKEKYFFFMASSICLSFISALGYYILSRWANKTSLNSKGNTGNPIVDIFNGRILSPKILGFDVKLECFRFSMIGLAVLNVLMVTDSIVKSGGKASPTVILAAAFQVIYTMDAMFFEEYYFHSHDAMNSGFGWSLISSYLTFPFLPTLVTRYLLDRSPEVAWYYLVLIGLMNGLGYVIYRSSESQRCEFAKDPSNPALAHLETVSTAGNRKLLVSGWWGMVRHPNYLGEMLVQWSWVLPAVGSLGLTDVVPYYLPVVTSLMLMVRCHQINQRNKRKYGNAWTSYCEKVRSNIIPKVY
jgi:lamin-B receptor